MTLLPVQLAVSGDLPALAVRVAGLSLAAGIATLVAGTAYRWYARTRMHEGLSMLIGVSVVALYLNSRGALSAVIGGDTELLSVETAVLNVVTFGLAALVAVAGSGLGARLGQSILEAAGERSLGTDVSTIVRTAGRVTTVTLPPVEEIDDIETYDPVPPEVKEKLGEEAFTFPRRLTLDELRSRFVERLRTDYGVGQVDVEFDDEGGIEYLALGSRESGIGPTLPPESAAVAVQADPAFAASAGDVVHVFEPGADGPSRVAAAEFRATAGDVVTLAVDASDATRFDESTRYRLVTHPVEPRSDREFASLLRAAEETMGVTTITEGSGLVGVPLGALDVAVAAVRGPEGPIEAIPSRDRTLAAGDTLYAVARPGRLARLDGAATGETGVGSLLTDADD